MSSIPHPDEPGNDLASATRAGQRPEKQSAAQQLVAMALEIYDLGVDADGAPFGVRKGGHVARPLTGMRCSLRQELSRLFYRETGRVASNNALAETVAVLDALAEDRGEPVELALRAARTADGVIYVDLGDHDEHVLRITADGWEVLDGDADIPVIFRRTRLAEALPIPEPGGDLDTLWQFVNMPDEADRQVMRGWLVAAYALVGLPCPILALLGEQGTAKTSSIKRALSLVDPSAAPVRRPPKDGDRYLHAVKGSRVTAFDNLSSIPRWLSDSMCRTVTGESDVSRSLYTDGDEYIVRVQSVLGFTGIDVGALAGDLAERCVWGELAVISAADRRSEADLNAAWEAAYPSMLGGLLDLVVATLAALPSIALAEKPRMADFAEVLAALDAATGGDGLEHYQRMHDAVADDIVDTDHFLVALGEHVTARWEGTSKELHELLPKPADDKYWPEARGVNGKLRRSAPDLRKAGWVIEEVRPEPASKRAKTWVLVPPGLDRITDEDVARVRLLAEMRAQDVEAWTDRLVADGMDPAEAATDVGLLRTVLAVHDDPERRKMVQASLAIDGELRRALSALGLSAVEFDQLVAEREQGQGDDR